MVSLDTRDQNSKFTKEKSRMGATANNEEKQTDLTWTVMDCHGGECRTSDEI